MFKPGDVVAFYSDVAGKRKFHICVSLNGCYLFLNSPKPNSYPGDLIVDCTELPFIDPTPSGKSIVSCSMVLYLSDRDLQKGRARKLGEAGLDLMMQILAHVEATDVLSDVDRDAVVAGLGDYF